LVVPRSLVHTLELTTTVVVVVVVVLVRVKAEFSDGGVGRQVIVKPFLNLDEKHRCVRCGWEIQSKFESQKNVMRNNKIEDELIVPSIVQ